ncbi:hypothetical protein M3223_05780 [Paenibacillus pasadenensis]|uniref:hypothetical protein n=1 Tax=Paenibacillus pasadenensis TaxID=217090 RepID=UPI0020423CE8|nr:hypothetical protein [Paenibacillus pasadenensis]MCM3746862.1 hypothetical protein [Paenibacillus pasadenensis]
MEHEFAQISAYSSIGITLVLFILLVIVTSFFCYKPDKNRNVSTQYTFEFTLTNLSTKYWLRFSSRTGKLIRSKRFLYPGDSDILYLTFDGIEEQISTITYRVYSVSDTNIPPEMLGDITIQVEGIPGLVFTRVVGNTSPATVYKQGSDDVEVHD